MVTIYGIRNCDKCRAALKWFAGRGVSAHLHDLREDGLDESLYRSWQAAFTDDELLNRRSQTWRKIPPGERESLSPSSARQLALRYPTVIKRPLVSIGKHICVGYDEKAWDKLL